MVQPPTTRIDKNTLERVEKCLRGSPSESSDEIIEYIQRTYISQTDLYQIKPIAYRIVNILRMRQDCPGLFIAEKLDLHPPSNVKRTQGSSGVVYQANISENQVAVKLLKDFILENRYSNLENGFLNEVKMWRSIEPHRNISSLHGCYAEVNHEKGDIDLALVSPWAELGSLKCWHTTLDGWEKTYPLILDVAKGLLHLHTQPEAVVHGDLCCSNVLVALDSDSELESKVETKAKSRIIAKLTDFGIAKHHGTESSLTRGGFTAELKHYERFGPNGNGGRSTASDIFGFGSLIFELFLGSEARFGNPPKQPKRPDCLADTKYDDLWLLVQDCWAQDPQKKLDASRVVERLKAMEPATRNE